MVSVSEAFVKGFVEEFKEFAGATAVLQSETGGAEGQTYLLFEDPFAKVRGLWSCSGVSSRHDRVRERVCPNQVHWSAALMGGVIYD